MPKTSEVAIGSFAGGVTGAVRSGSELYFETLRHFELTTDPFKLTPVKSVEADEDTTKKIQQFLYASDGGFYGRGVDTSTGNKIEIYTKSPAITGSWATVTGGVSTSNLSFSGCFRDFENYVLGVCTNGNVFRWGDITGTPSFTEAWQTLSTTPSYVTQGIIGPNTDFYFGWNRYVALVSSGFSTFDEDNFIAPSNLTVRSLENYGNYLAIGCSGDGIGSESKAFLWNQIDADPDVRIDFGLDVLWHLAVIDGGLYAIMLSNNSTLTDTQKLLIKRWNGGGEQDVEVVEQIDLGGTGFSLLKEKFVQNNRIYFGLNKNDDTDSQKGIWSYGRASTQLPFSLVHEVKPDNDTLITTMNGFYKLASTWWVSHSSDGSVNRTNNDGSYSATSVAQTCIFSGSNPARKKRILGCEIAFEPLPSAGQVTVKASVNGGAYSTILTETTDNAVYAGSTDVDSLEDFQDVQWQLESTGGAVITGFRFLYTQDVKSSIS